MKYCNSCIQPNEWPTSKKTQIKRLLTRMTFSNRFRCKQKWLLVFHFVDSAGIMAICVSVCMRWLWHFVMVLTKSLLPSPEKEILRYIRYIAKLVNCRWLNFSVLLCRSIFFAPVERKHIQPNRLKLDFFLSNALLKATDTAQDFEIFRFVLCFSIFFVYKTYWHHLLDLIYQFWQFVDMKIYNTIEITSIHCL